MVEMEFGVPIPGEILPEDRWAKTALKRMPLPPPLNWEAIFGRKAPVVVELGCGNARYTLLSALTRPDHNHFASDLLPMAIRYATRRANQRGLSNARLAVCDAETVVGRFLAPESVAEIHLYHPQPYHDPRQMLRRLVTPRFVANVFKALQPGGTFVVQTDNPDYWGYMTKLLPTMFDFQERAEPWPDAPEGRSRREILARSRGLTIYRGLAVPRTDVTPEIANDLAGMLPMPTFRTHGPWCDLDEIEERGGP